MMHIIHNNKGTFLVHLNFLYLKRDIRLNQRLCSIKWRTPAQAFPDRPFTESEKLTSLHPLHILQLVPEPLPSYRADVSTLFGKYLPRHQVYCDIVGKPGQPGATPGGFNSLCVPTRHARRWRQELAFLMLCLRKVWRARAGQCDVIQVRDMVSIGLLSMLLARAKGMPFTYWVSFLMCDGRIERSRAELKRRPGSLHYRLALYKGLVEKVLFYKVVLAHADHVFVQSEAMKRLMIERGIAADKLTAVPMGVDMETLSAMELAPRPLTNQVTAPVIAYLGTLDRSRKIEELLDALAIVRQQHPAVRLLLIGSSPTPSDVELLKAHAQGLGVEDAVDMTGWLDSAEALPLLLGADVAVSYVPRGALFDVSSPTKLLEYLALGMPAVGNDSPDQTRVLGESGAGWLSASTAVALAAALCEVLGDRDAAQARAAAGPAYIARNRSYRVLSAALAQRYHSLVDHLRRPAAAA